MIVDFATEPAVGDAIKVAKVTGASVVPVRVTETVTLRTFIDTPVAGSSTSTMTVRIEKLIVPTVVVVVSGIVPWGLPVSVPRSSHFHRRACSNRSLATCWPSVVRRAWLYVCSEAVSIAWKPNSTSTRIDSATVISMRPKPPSSLRADRFVTRT